MLAIVDYGVGNLFSLTCSLRAIGAEVTVTGEEAVLAQADRIILPGVGAFGDAAQALRASGLDRAVLQAAERGKPLLGICLGMQLLFDYSTEYGRHDGLGLIPGSVQPIRPVIPADYKVPHIGWNGLHFPKDRPVSPLFRHIQEGDCVYFVHSFYGAGCAEHTIATAEYGPELTAAVARNNVYGAQFHPEKSGPVGLNILKAFCEL
ncbi:imidazole glycerol phosphate synthase subunit HisH [Pseudoflavonifractor sp. 60]|uniref:imidazole glycerol phosphate synthase subunit HisH n=1 Tax=Pseudoflavonifractor sp. 60 TaxID=2304576 RepID=UPI00136D8A75|nr:imidazole glycerol phosphate synthase subunit HisH [Pseudoflavonifractor sp. 60]NBI69139.1 imidazole glycerol phosphate synthase subunit HisH [Pseudoflavonifractor sp. 60]